MIRQVELCGRSVEYDLQRKNVKNINLRIKSDGSVCVSANNFVSVDTVERFMRDKADFILGAIDRAEKRLENTPAELKYVSGESMRILGKDRVLQVVKGTKNQASFNDDASEIILAVRDTKDSELKKKTLGKWKKELCRNLIEELCKRTYAAYPVFSERGIPFPELHFKTMKTRWGSCNSKGGSLNFNFALIHAPLKCVEYVVLHEFVHFLHPDHSKNFYGTLASLMPDWKQRKNELEDQNAKFRFI